MFALAYSRLEEEKLLSDCERIRGCGDEGRWEEISYITFGRGAATFTSAPGAATTKLRQLQRPMRTADSGDTAWRQRPKALAKRDADWQRGAGADGATRGRSRRRGGRRLP